MLTQQGSLDWLHDPIALGLLRSSRPAYITCAGEDGASRIVPVPFHWDGAELVLCPRRNALTMPIFQDGAEISLSIDSDAPPWTVLLIRGTACAALSASCEPVVGLRPVWVGMLDFRARVDVDRQQPRSGS